jgi:hypothetical protein
MRLELIVFSESDPDDLSLLSGREIGEVSLESLELLWYQAEAGHIDHDPVDGRMI